MKIRFLIAMMLIGLGVNAQSTNNITGIVKFVENPQLATIDTTATKLIGRKTSDGRIVRYNWAAIKAYMNAGGSTPTLQEVINSGSTATTANPIVMNGQGGQISLNNQGVTIISGNGVNTFYVSDTVAKFYSRAQGIPAIHNNELTTLGQVNTLVSGQDLQTVLNSGSAATVNTNVLINHGAGATYSNIALEDGSSVLGTLSNNLKVTNTTAVIGSALTVGEPVGDDDAVRLHDLQGYIPLSGTISGAPVTGNIEVPFDNPFSLYANDGSGTNIGFRISDRPEMFGGNGGYSYNFSLNQSGGLISATDPLAHGLIGQSDFTANATNDLDYVQRKGIAAMIAAAGGGGTVTSVTGVSGETTVANGTTTPVIGIDPAYTAARIAYADGKVQNSLNPSTTIAPSATAVNTGLATKEPVQSGAGVVTKSGTTTTYTPVSATPTSGSTDLFTSGGAFTSLAGKATLGGDAATATMILGTTNSFNLTLIRNNVNQLNLDGSYIRAFMPFTSATVANGVLSLLTTGVDVTRTQTTGVSFTTGNTNASNTGDLFNVKNSTGVVGGFRSDGRGYGAAGTATNDYATVSQLTPAYRATTTSTTLTATDYTVTLTSGTATFTLPTAVGITGKIYIVKNKGAGVLTINTTSSQTMDGATTATISTTYAGRVLQSNGTNWDVIGLF